MWPLILEDPAEGLGVDLSGVLTLGADRGVEQHPKEPLRAVETSPQIVVLAIVALEERPEVALLHSAQLHLRRAPAECLHVAGTQPDDLDPIELRDVAHVLKRVDESVPIRESQVSNEHVGPNILIPSIDQIVEGSIDRLAERLQAISEICPELVADGIQRISLLFGEHTYRFVKGCGVRVGQDPAKPTAIEDGLYVGGDGSCFSRRIRCDRIDDPVELDDVSPHRALCVVEIRAVRPFGDPVTIRQSRVEVVDPPDHEPDPTLPMLQIEPANERELLLRRLPHAPPVPP